MICNMEGGGGAIEATKDEVVCERCSGRLAWTKAEKSFRQRLILGQRNNVYSHFCIKRRKIKKTAHLGSGCSVVLH